MSEVAPLSSETPAEFVHLHVHTQYSLLQGAIHVESLLERAKELGMKSVAITDTNNLFGAVDFYQQAKKAGIKPILGCEILYAPQGRASLFAPAAAGTASAAPKVHHLVLLCKNLEGYRNLCQMVTRAYTEAPPPQKGQGSTPRTVVDRELLDKFGDHLIVLSGCLRGELPYKIWAGDEEGALQSFHWFKKRFGDDYYLELQDMGLPEQDQINETLYAWGQKHGVKCVATADCHYLHPRDGEAHEILQCIEHGYELDFDRPKSLVPAAYCLQTAAEMRARFERYPEACDETLRIAEKCDVRFKFKDEQGRPIYHLPNFRPEGVEKGDDFDLIAYFKDESRKGLEVRFGEPGFVEKVSAPDWAEKKQEYYARLESELSMIEKTGFAGYFLIVSDFILWAKKEGIPVGPGRGSGAGSLVAYVLQITDIDPIQFKLLFERFINPERISMPDFDVDFCQDRRGEVIDYVTRKYGSDRVSQIITFGKLQTRAVIKDVGRVLGFSFAETDQITKLVPEELNISLSDAIEKEPRLQEKRDQDPKVNKWIDYALSLEGLYRSAGMHAAGVIITEEPIVNYCPLFVGRDGAMVTQFDKDSCEAIGLVKFDFLGLKTLTVIDHAVKLVRLVAKPGTPEKNFELGLINYSDPKVFALISSGDTDGVFQVESSGMKDLCMRIQPGSLEDITAINALYRPGPLQSGMVDDFIDRKHGRQEIKYDVDSLESILKETYGVILYQEQVMQIARELAGYSLGQADMLRRAMGKKKAEEMAEHRSIFVAGSSKLGLPAEKAEGIFDLMAKFAEYGFNKSHSAAYGVLTYQTAYLKAYFPAEFMAALMTTEMTNTDKITKYISDCRSHGMAVLPPDVNRSHRRFTVETIVREPKAGDPPGTLNETKVIRFGLEAIKGVGGTAVDSILAAREERPFDSVLDLCQRVSTRKVNKKVMESLVLAGALDSVAEVNRASLFASLEGLLQFAADEQEERELGQVSLFDSFGKDEVKLLTSSAAIFKQEPDWPRSRSLSMERQVVGFYMSGHPMDPWQKICLDWLGWSTEKLKQFAQEKAHEKASQKPKKEEEAPPWQGGGGGGGRYNRPSRPEVKLGGLIGELREVMTKKGTRMAFGNLEDTHGKVEVIFFPDAYATMQEQIKQATAEAEPLLVTAELDIAEEIPKLLVKSLQRMEEAHLSRVQSVVLAIDLASASSDQLRALKKNLIQNRGKCPVRLDFKSKEFRTHLLLPKNVGVLPSPQMVTEINRIFGGDVVKLL